MLVHQPAAVLPLPSEVASRLRSDVIVRSLAQAVEELVANSIDAGATKVRVTVSQQTLEVTVDDDGRGICPESMERLGARHCTSKLPGGQAQFDAGDFPTLGFRGEALASVADHCLLEVSSRAQGSLETMEAAFVGGKRLRLAPSQTQRTAHGTLVRVRDFLYRQPVRRKQMMRRTKTEVEQIKGVLLGLWLAHHQQCGFLMVETHKWQKLLTLSKDADPQAYVTQIFGKRRDALLLDSSVSSTSDTPIGISVTGAVSHPRAPQPGRSSQHLFVNGRRVESPEVASEVTWIWQRVNEAAQRAKGDKSGGGRAKGPAGFPAFVIFLTMPPALFDVTSECDKTHIEFNIISKRAVLDVLRSACIRAMARWAPHSLLAEATPHSQPPASCSPDARAAQSRLATFSYEAHQHQHASLQQNRLGMVQVAHSAISLGLHCPSALSEAHQMSEAESDTGQAQGREDTWLDTTEWGSCASQEVLPEPPTLPGREDWLQCLFPGNCPADSTASLGLQGNLWQPLPQADDCCYPETRQQPGCLSRGGPPSWQRPVGEDALAQPSAHPLPSRAGRDRGAPEARDSQDATLRTGLPLRTPVKVESRRLAVASPRPLGDWVDVPGLEAAETSPPPTAAPPESAGVSAAPSEAQPKAEGEPQPDETPGPRRASWPLCSGGPARRTVHRTPCSSVSTKAPAGGCPVGRPARGVVSLLQLRQRKPRGGSRHEEAPAANKGQQSDNHQERSKGDSDIPGGQAAQPTEKEAMPLGEQEASEDSADEPVEADRPNKRRRRSLLPFMSSWLTSEEPLSETDCLRAGDGWLSSPGLVPGTLTRAAFDSGLRALGQLDTNYIAAVGTGCDGEMVLLMVDQHAADERVLLEELQAQVPSCQGGDASASCKSAALSHAIDIDLELPLAGALQRYHQRVEAWGWRLELSTPDQQGRKTRQKVAMTGVPSLLGVQLKNPMDLRVYLAALQETCGSAGVPQAVQRLLISKACRGAVMFGDRLSHTECQQLLDRLTGTELCFDCAHGRPTMVPMVDLQMLRCHCGRAAGPSPHRRVRPAVGRLTVASLQGKLTDE